MRLFDLLKPMGKMKERASGLRLGILTLVCAEENVKFNTVKFILVEISKIKKYFL